MNSLLDDIISLLQSTNNIQSDNNQIEETKTFYIKDDISTEKIQEIIDCNAKSINIGFKSTNYYEIFSAINKINSAKQNVSYRIYITDKNSFNDFVFNNIDILPLNNIQIMQSERANENVDFNEYVRKEKVLLDMVAPARDLSPLEQYLYAYNITKNFKEYNPSEESWNASRSLYDILDNEYIVCAGYTRLLEDLLDKLGIKSRQFGVKVYDEDANIDGNHSLIQVKLKDEKYGINGIYFGDPTNDSDMIYDYYNYALMSNIRKPYIPDNSYDETACFFEANSVEEFYDRFTKWNNNQDNKEEAFRQLSKEFLAIIRKFDNLIYTDSFKKFESLLGNDLDEENMQLLLSEIANYVSTNLNNDVSEDIKMDAIRQLYEKFYGFPNENAVNSALMETMQINSKYENGTNNSIKI